MNLVTRAFFILYFFYYCDGAGYGGPPVHETQSDVGAPAYAPANLRNQEFSKTSSPGTKTYSSRKSYSSTKTRYAGTKTGGTKSGYAETKTWHSNTGNAPSYSEFQDNAHMAYAPICDPECKNSGICVDTNTCHCSFNFYGRFCEFEKKPCLTYPPLPMNSRRQCTSDTCTITCAAGHKFPDHSTVASMRCAEGQWTPTRADFTVIPDCEPECNPPCLNGGVCLARDVCQCSQDWKGPQCQYSSNACDVRKLGFNGGYNCFGDGESFSCRLSCPAGSAYSSPLAELYTCTYATGMFQPQPIPRCVFNDVYIVTPSNNHGDYSHHEYHSWSNSSHSGHGGSEHDAHSGFDEQHSGFDDQHSGFDDQHSGFDDQHSGFDEQHSGFDEQHSGFDDQHSGFDDQHSGFDDQHSGFDDQHSGFDDQHGGFESSNQTKVETFDQYGQKHPMQVVVIDHTPRGGVCLTWAGVHYKTFDGKIYSFESKCQHILLREAKEHKYTIVVQPGDCKGRSYCPLQIGIYLEDKLYTLSVGEDSSVVFRSTRRLIPLPAALPGLRAAMPAGHVVVDLDAAGVTIKWDTNNIVAVEGSVLLWNNTEGLCGSLDGNPENDFLTKEGAVAQTRTVMASSWQLNKIGDICESNPTETSACESKADADMKKALQFCTKVFTKDKFRKCSKVMDVSQLLETCQWDYCACSTAEDQEDCACNTVYVYAKQCSKLGIEEMKNWRDAETCPMKCPEGKIYKSCGPETQPSCAFPSVPSSADNTTCVEGCYCPEGLLLEGGRCLPKSECPCRLRNKSFPPGATVNKECNTCTCEAGSWACTAVACGARCGAVGDPHYTTFDGRRYDFMGKCTYNLLTAENITVDVENVACSGAISEAMNLAPYNGEGKPSCTKAVNLKYKDANIHLKQGGFILINGQEVTSLPVMAAGVKIRTASSLFLIVQLPNKVDLWWDGNTRVFVDVPASFQGKTKGLCGTFNLNQNDDFLTPEGDIEQSAHAFANKWKTRELCDDLSATEPEHPCRVNVENKETAEKYCNKLKSRLFEECHWYVDVESYYDACLYDMCACASDASRCLCPILADYADQCATNGVKVQWRLNVKECELSCPGGQEYTVCADSCQRTCADVAAAADCRPRCVEGCACPPGQVLNADSVCVPVGLCPCFHKGMQFDSGYKEVRAGARERELCTCVGALWDCQSASDADMKNYPPAEDLRSNCSAVNHMEFTACEVAEPLTCKNMHLPPTTTSSECRPGCRCKKGFVLDSVSKKCVQPSSCPCHHGGASYPDGHVMQEECNTCECASGNWSCTTAECPGTCSVWGDSHATTFDGARYDFQGVCTYLLAKGAMDGKDGFDVEIQNVPCGTTGATCSKSLTLKVGSGHTGEVVSLTKDAPLPNVSHLKRIKLRVSGVFVFLDVVSLGASVRWDRGTRAAVRLDPMWRGRVKGLCGNYNLDQRDDFQTPTGGIPESSALIFVDSWKLKTTCPRAQEVPDHCSQRPERKDWASSACGALKRYPFTLCHTEVPVGDHLSRCERDACACDGGGDCECVCSALAAYAHDCAARGVLVKWRTKHTCPMQCDEECSQYSACLPACPPETCDNMLEYAQVAAACATDTCVEGCKPKLTCPEGQVYSNSSLSGCVPRAKCRPACMTLGDGREVLEGELLESDACHICTCSKGHRVCTGQPCSTKPEPRTFTTGRPNDEGLKCVSGWTEWVDRGHPRTGRYGESVETEPVPKLTELTIGFPMCNSEMMTKIECRTSINHQPAKDTGLDAECSLERGLVCKEKGHTCPDFAIRVYCQCEEEFQCLNADHPSYPHPRDCAQFYECTPDLLNPEKPHTVLKSCAPGLMYNPKTMVCDWPDAVIAIRPECGKAKPTTVAPIATTHPTPPAETTYEPTTSPCPPGEVYEDCAYACERLCDYFTYQLKAKGQCLPGDKCVSGCVDSEAYRRCSTGGSRWRDHHTCVALSDCTCQSDGNLVKPGGVVTKNCTKCQCLDNALHCSSSECRYPEVSVMPIRSTPETTKATPTTHAPTTPTTRPPTPPTTHETTPGVLIVKNTATPPPVCEPSRYIDLLWDREEPLPESAFSASSVASDLFLPQYAILDGRPLDITAGSWNPTAEDTHPYIQVALPHREPIYGVKLQGSPLFDQYVTSYELMYGDDGHTFATVDGPDGKPRVFRGPTDHKTAMKQIIEPPIEARVVRVKPLTWHEEVAVRMELIGCKEFLVTSTTVRATTAAPMCTDELGLAAGLPVESIEVSSNFELRRNFALDAGLGWRPAYTTPGEWIMFDFSSPRNLTGIKTKGGPEGWVTLYNVMYTSDLNTFNPVMDDSGSYKMFPGNFDADSVVTNTFRLPIRARYLKLLPLKWRDHIEMRVEPLGCFEPYPIQEEETAKIRGSTPAPQSCEPCPGITASHCACGGLTRYYDGEDCVTRDQCPCVESYMPYAVGSSFLGAGCESCVCKLGGVTVCKPAKECVCAPNLVPTLTPSCECLCEPCPPATRICPTSHICLSIEQWCDGIQNCPDDESNCGTTYAPHVVTNYEPRVVTTVGPTVGAPNTATTGPTGTTSIAEVTTAKPLQCPEVECPPGYFPRAVPAAGRRAASDLPPPRARKSYNRYYKGAKGGSVKGGYAKGGYAKGGTKGGDSKGGYTPSPPAPSPIVLDKPANTTNPTTEQGCAQFKCVPNLPPPFRPGATPTPVVCSPPICPANYSLKMDNVPLEPNQCPQYVCVPPPERPVFCSVTGRTFNTFDGTEYKYDVCFHILARDNRLGAWSVLIRKKCRVEGCQNELLVHQDDQLIVVKPNLMIDYDNYEYTVEQTSMICFQKNSFHVDQIGNGILITSRRYNFTVLYNSDGDVKVGVLKTSMGTVDGLCGAFDGNPANDRSLPDGNLATTVDEFGRAWAKPGLPASACQAKLVPPERQRRAWELCEVIMQEPLNQCGKVLNLDKWRSICLEKICECADLVVDGKQRTDEECRCILLEQLVSECLAADKEVDVAGWRVKRECPASCPAPLVHYDCYGKQCEPSCRGSGANTDCPAAAGLCWPGCYCPEGTLRRGDECLPPSDCLDCACTGIGSPSKYVSFEGDDIPSFGNCTYLASRDISDKEHQYQVYATSGPCPSAVGGSCVQSVHLLYKAHVFTVTRDRTSDKLLTVFDDEPLYKYPSNKDWSIDGDKDVVIWLKEAHVEVTVLHMNMEFSVKVPSVLYSGSTEGLCGVCAGRDARLRMANGTYTEDIELYGKSWQASPEVLEQLSLPKEQCAEAPPPPPCAPPPPGPHPCDNLYNADRFGPCYALIDVTDYVSSCEADVCAGAAWCGSLQRYADDCRRKGVCLDWRKDLCPLRCEEPLVYRPCVDCERTCDNPDSKCKKNNLEGCFCPEGKVRVNNTCIEPSKCYPCDANKDHYAGDEWQEDECTKCTCTKTPSGPAHAACTTQGCAAPLCREREDRIARPKRPGDCCQEYVCVPKVEDVKCKEPKKIDCGYGQVLKQKSTSGGCIEFACECKPPSECEDIPSSSEVELLEPGMQRDIDSSGCCPRARTYCQPSTCPEPPHCERYHTLDKNNDTGKCCPEYKCEAPKDKCIVKLEWEAAAKGGEKARSEPEIVLKDTDAVWRDGPCRQCRCEPPLGAPAAPAPAPAARCAVAECPALAAGSASVIVEPRPVPFQCCPVAEYKACRDGDQVYKPGENWTSSHNPCESYRCARVSGGKLEILTTVQECHTDCEPGWEYIPATTDSGLCCGRCKPVSCECEGIHHPIGQHWTSEDHCVSYTCVLVNSTLQIQSSNVSCPEVSDAERKQFVIDETKVPGECCPKREPTACRVGNDIYQEGQSWPSPDPCRKYTCLRDSSGRLSHAASVQRCESCPRPRRRREPKSGECCGACVQEECVVGEEMKKPGSKWYSADNCTTYYCDAAGDDVTVTMARQACPDVSGCAMEDLVNETCCQVCKEKPQPLRTCVPTPLPGSESVGLVRVWRGARGYCVNKQPLTDFKECRGTCQSGTLYNNQTGSHDSNCECCQASSYEPITLTLTCEDGSPLEHRVASPAACGCQRCGGETRPSKNGGTKNPSRAKTEAPDYEIPEIYRRFGSTETL